MNFNTASNGGRPPLDRSTGPAAVHEHRPKKLEVHDLSKLFERIALCRQFPQAILDAPETRLARQWLSPSVVGQILARSGPSGEVSGDVQMFLLEQGERYPAKPWTMRHRVWLTDRRFVHPGQQIAFQSFLNRVEQAEARKKELEDQIAELTYPGMVTPPHRHRDPSAEGCRSGPGGHAGRRDR